ncbi:glycosyltransferase family 2 protein [Frankia sp. Mgl5]|uniref:glycosyltransferase family 2 protein n=1 Tax=Frankia sp. Mgl5 TaxID=2933793 RepID=UPI00200CED96|nr:glycosyltransferase family 2 protein [Frankia sp. Mgl5]MCK9931851.1 glycosyltransferase family 2 protein [Frankia sp. Mgl5]
MTAPRSPGRRGWPVRYDPARPAPGAPAPGTVPASAIILARDEAVNIARAVASVQWCRQVVVVDSGSTDATTDIARAAGATIWHEPWRGFAAQREWAMRAQEIAHDWVFFLDADEWVSVDLAQEIAARLGTEDCAAYAQRRRLVFAGRWIAHCGWYTNSWQARLLDRRRASFDTAAEYGERATVTGRVLRLAGDLVDEDAKGLPAWLRRHVGYAELEARRRAAEPSPARQLLTAVRARGTSTRPLARALAKEVVYPLVPARPLALFVYMYVLRAGWRDGFSGLLFCLYHAWYELTVTALGRIPLTAGAAGTGNLPSGRDAVGRAGVAIPAQRSAERPREATPAESTPAGTTAR